MNRILEYIGILAIILISCNDTTQNNCNCRNVFLFRNNFRFTLFHLFSLFKTFKQVNEGM
jgi:hypothetical protein